MRPHNSHVHNIIWVGILKICFAFFFQFPEKTANNGVKGLYKLFVILNNWFARCPTKIPCLFFREKKNAQKHIFFDTKNWKQILNYVPISCKCLLEANNGIFKSTCWNDDGQQERKAQIISSLFHFSFYFPSSYEKSTAELCCSCWQQQLASTASGRSNEKRIKAHTDKILNQFRIRDTIRRIVNDQIQWRTKKLISWLGFHPNMIDIYSRCLAFGLL